MLLATLISWQKPLRERVGLYALLCLLGFPVQPMLASSGEHHRIVGMLHPVDAIVLLGLSGALARQAWAARRAGAREPEPAALAATGSAS